MVRFCFSLAFVVAPAAARAAEPSPAGIAFFESKVRPVFVDHCIACHGKEKQKGDLRLDSPAAILKGGENGPVVIPGKPDASPLIKAIRHKDPDLAMPPKGKMAEAPIAALTEWVAIGAPLPRDAATPTGDAKAHWAFQPLKPSATASIDALLLAKWKTAGLTPSPAADKRTLLRRVFLDLTGIPPSWEEVQAFEKDASPDAFAKVVDKLLASPRYGERWARHWLDVARYADTKDGVLMFGDDRLRPFAYTYRDYVIRAFNEDVPFDRFVLDQLAADQVEKGEPWRLAAMGFLTLGRMFDNNIHDVIDDRIDTVTRGLLGLTVSCARCHDHKYDPIPTADYYSLYGVFASSESPDVPPLLDPSAKGPEAFEKAYAAKQAEIRKMETDQYALLLEAARSRAGDYLVRAATTEPDPLETAVFFMSLGPDELRPPITAKWRGFLAKRVNATDPVFGPWHDLFALPPEKLAAESKAVFEKWKGRANPRVLEALGSAKLAGKEDVARAYGALLKKVYDESKAAKAPMADADKPLLEVVTSKDSPAWFPKTLTRNYMSRAEKDSFGGKLVELDRLAAKAKDAPDRAMTMVDASELHDPHVFIRGNAARPGAAVPRQFLAAVSAERKPFTHGSGRLDLANAIIAKDNPLTARVMANRVWMHHFGEPLVSTPNDFGLRTAAPVQAELLDHLALYLRDNGWSLKKLHRYIVLSSAYRQSSFDRAECRRIDPENKLLWRQTRKRLEFEAMRDALQFASGRLEEKLYGRPSGSPDDPNNRRRAVYALVDRQSLPGVFRAFDFASPDQSAERRPQTTVPQQALFGMNSAFVIEQAMSLAARPEVAKAAEPAAKVKAMYRLTLARDPDADEVRIGVAFVAAAEKSTEKQALGAWAQFAQILLLTNEMMFVDELA
ncbi:MAG: PSD1 and planctomycete cytochrome C domain-containing protein [Gemmataceae bacterium]